VAPVNKLVTYGTVTNIPGEPAKCWITQNLGSSRQAEGPYDATEPSAGWYWQFNRMQGYMHDGIGRTPGTVWTPISEDAGWQPANDPCAIELGAGWRVPTYNEYENIRYAGNWSDINGPWYSDLKMHAAGYLEASDGSLSARGGNGLYWSNNQVSYDISNNLQFTGSTCFMAANWKHYGMTIRCIRE
jgi:hypothetical protein